MTVTQSSRRAIIFATAAMAIGAQTGWAQAPGRIYRLGFVVQPMHHQFRALFDELRQHGFIEGQNLSVDPRGFGTSVDRLDTAASAVAAAGPNAIYAGGDEAGRAAQRATTTIPIVVLADDMVRARLVASLARPGGNITGVSILATELDNKRLEVLLQLVPGATRIGALIDPRTTAADQVEGLIAAGRGLGIELLVYRAAVAGEIGPAIAASRTDGIQALNVLASALFNANRAIILEDVANARLPAIYQWPDYAQEGALVCYGPRLDSLYRQAAGLISKVLGGSNPAGIPVEQPTKIELLINLKTAKALNLIVPQSLLQRADEVIE